MATPKVDLIAAARQRMDMTNAPAWIAEDGDELIGHVAMLMMGDGGEYGPYPIVVYTVESMNGETPETQFVKVHAFHTLLQDRLKELKTQIGSYQMLKYFGENKSNKRVDKDGEPQTYHHYDVQDLNALAVAEEVKPFQW